MTLLSDTPVEGTTIAGRRVSPHHVTILGGAGLVLLALAGTAFFLRAQQALTGNLWGVPLDDAYIHFQFARNLGSGQGFSFNAGQPIPGSTSPLWTLLLAAAVPFGVPLWLAAKVYGVLFLVLAALLTWRLARRIVDMPVAAWAAGALTALDGRLLWAAPSGMEVTFFTALSLGAFLARPTPEMPARRARRHALIVAALCALATLARPEGYLLTLVLFVDLYRRDQPAARTAALSIVLYLVLALPYNVFAFITTGSPLPTTFSAKAIPFGPATLPGAVHYVEILLILVLQTNFVLLIFALIGAPLLWRQGGMARALVAWPLLLIAEQALVSPLLYHFGRYVMPLEPFFALWAVVGARRLTRAARTDLWRPALPALTVVLVGVLNLRLWVSAYSYATQNIDAMHVALGAWVRAHVPPGVAVATHDIGAIGYISGHPVVDIEGLVTPRFIALKREWPLDLRGRDILAEIRRDGARYVIVFPTAYRWLAAQPGLRRVYSSPTLRYRVIVQEPTMAVYALGRNTVQLSERPAPKGAWQDTAPVGARGCPPPLALQGRSAAMTVYGQVRN